MALLKKLFPLILLLVVSWYTHIFTMMHQRPQSVHMWAMCDRGSVARNYAQDSMDFFHPRVHETKEGEGISGMEFPVMNYLAAVCYKIFGFNEFWYRLLMFLVHTAGIAAAYAITGFFLQQTANRLLTVALYISSPVMTYYAANFIPDTAALGFAMISWYFFFRWRRDGKTVALLPLFLFAALAALIKITTLIGVLILAGLVVFTYLFRSNKLGFEKINRPVLFFVLLATMVVAYGWIQYAKHLNETYGLSVFLMRSMTPENMESIRNTFKHINEIWVPFYFFKPIYFVLLAALITVVVFHRRISQLLLLVTTGYFFGVCGFAYLMLLQFNDHDYYLITLFPLVFFLLLSAFEVFERSGLEKKWSFGFQGALAIIVLLGLQFNRKHQEFRMDEHCWLYDWARYKDYQEVEPYIKSLSIDHTQKVIAICDYSPNIALYFLNLKGWSVADVADDQPIINALQHKPEYVVLTDTAQLSRPVFKDHPLQPVGEFKSIRIYRIRL